MGGRSGRDRGEERGTASSCSTESARHLLFLVLFVSGLCRSVSANIKMQCCRECDREGRGPQACCIGSRPPTYTVWSMTLRGRKSGSQFSICWPAPSHSPSPSPRLLIPRLYGRRRLSRYISWRYTLFLFMQITLSHYLHRYTGFCHAFDSAHCTVLLSNQVLDSYVPSPLSLSLRLSARCSSAWVSNLCKIGIGALALGPLR